MTKDSSKPSPAPDFDGRWVQRERQRMAMGRPALAQKLDVSPSEISRLERKNLPVPTPWIAILARVGFHLPAVSFSNARPKESAPLGAGALPTTGPAGTEPAAAAVRADPTPPARAEPVSQPAAPAPRAHVPQAESSPAPRTGEWLRTFCREHGVTLEQISQSLGLPLSTVSHYARGNRPLPAWWLPTVESLTLRAPQPDQNELIMKSPNGSAELVETILSFRLKYGRLTGQAPAEILIGIGKDLSQAGAGRIISYEAVEQAMKILLQPLLSDRSK